MLFSVFKLISRKRRQSRRKIQKQLQRQQNIRNNRKIITRSPLYFQTRKLKRFQKIATNQALAPIRRFSRLTNLHRLSVKNIASRKLKKLLIDDVAKNILKNKDSVCLKRAKRKKAILAHSRGRGIRVKKAKWTSESYIRCKG